MVGECTTGENYLYGWRIPKYSWAFQASSVPYYLASRTNGTALVIDAVKRANNNVVTGRNLCGRADAISATFAYLGTTTRAPNIASWASCTGGNGYSTVGFGSLPSGVVAMACAYRIVNGTASEGDMKLSSAVRWATTTAGCVDAYLIEAVMTHEVGHIYGLKHVSSSVLTMYRGMRKCSMAAATLGLGDLRGLERKY
jgi:Zn-dependent protease with chaperone function